MTADEHRAEAERLLKKAEEPNACVDRLILLAQLQALLAIDDRLAEFMQRPYGGEW